MYIIFVLLLYIKQDCRNKIIILLYASFYYYIQEVLNFWIFQQINDIVSRFKYILRVYIKIFQFSY